MKPEYAPHYYFAWWLMRAGLISTRFYTTREAMTPSKVHYVGVWQWDAFFHALAYRHVDMHLAEDQLRIALDHQRADGMIPDAIHDEGVITHLSFPVEADVTKPPLLAWTAWVRARRPDDCVFAAGASMGAAIVLLAAETEPFCAVIAEAPYATFRGAARLRVGRQFGLPPPIGPIAATPLVEAALAYTRLRYGLPIGLANPLDAVRTTRVPVLVIEDGDDDRMPAGDPARLAAANPRLVTVWHVAGARHVRAWAAEPDEYPRRVLAFLAAHQ